MMDIRQAAIRLRDDAKRSRILEQVGVLRIVVGVEADLLPQIPVVHGGHTRSMSVDDSAKELKAKRKSHKDEKRAGEGRTRERVEVRNREQREVPGRESGRRCG